MIRKTIQPLLVLMLASWPLLGGPLKVYIMAGQSNMQGHAQKSTLPYMADDPVTKALYDKILDEKGEARVYSDVSVAAFSEKGKGQQRKQGPLSIGFGKALFFTDPPSFGPELGFGITMVEKLKEPILIIKTAWGGKSLHTDYRPPSSKYEALLKNEDAGKYYRLMMSSIREVLNDPGKFCSTYDSKEGLELSGIVWFQGWNDLVDRNAYPENVEGERFDLYSKLLGDLIRDIRKDLSAPKMPFVIGVMGVDGTVADVKNDRGGASKVGFREAMAVPATWSEFKGNVFPVRTGQFWDFDIAVLDIINLKNIRRLRSEYEKLKGHPRDLPHSERKAYWKDHAHYIKTHLAKILAKELPGKDAMKIVTARSNGAYHYFGSGKMIGQIGEAFGKAMPIGSK
jgi:hypothetical protein